MGYELKAVIAGSGILEAGARDLPHAVLAPLEQGLSLLPITEEFFDSVTDGAPIGAHGFYFLPGGFESVLAAWSQAGPVAFVEASFGGGVGRQDAAVWSAGEIVLGPLHVEPQQPFGAAGSPISQALRRLGVVARAGEDEFVAAGLTRHRYTETWAGLDVD
jgi:hypothetical protein